jgi:diacylglycerol O-acyltransferase
MIIMLALLFPYHYVNQVIGGKKKFYRTIAMRVKLSNQTLVFSLQNAVSGAWGFFSMKDLDTKSLLKQVKTEMLAIKSSYAPRVLYEYFKTLSGYIPGISPPLAVYNHFCDIPHGVFTNVPGPTLPISFAGEQIQEYRTFSPQCGKGSISITLITYCGKVSIGAIADLHRKYPRLAEGVCERFTKEFGLILEEAKMELSKKETTSF